MRTVTICVRNNQKVELYTDEYQDGFEFWAVGTVDGRRVVIDHHLTHDDLETRLEYAQPRDLVWRDATRSEMPSEKHKMAVDQEETISRGVFWDYERRGPGQIQSVTCHLRAIDFLTIDRKSLVAAKRMLLGRWTDGVLTFSLEPNNQLQWSCADRGHWLNGGERVHGHAPNWWNAGKWGIGILNNKHWCGTHVGVLHVGERELHLVGGGHLHRMAYVFHRRNSYEQ
jgi:hypothetical protein